MRLFVSTAPPYLWARVNRAGRVKQEGSTEELSEVPVNTRSDEVFAVIPGEALVVRKVEIPSRNRTRVLQALPFALEEQLSEDIDAFHFIVLDWKPGQYVIAGIVAKDDVESWRSQFEQAGILMRGMLADFQLLPIHPRTNMTIARQAGGRVSVHGRDLVGASMDADLVDIWWNEMKIESLSAAVNDHALAARLASRDGATIKHWDVGTDFVKWLRSRPRNEPVFNLLPHTLPQPEERARVPGLRAAMFFLALGLLGKLGVDGYDYVLLERENSRLRSEMTRLFTDTFPEETRVVNARSQFRQKIAELNDGGQSGDLFQTLLATIAPAILATRSELQEINFREQSLEISCLVKRFEDLDLLKQNLEKRGVQVELVSSGSLAQQVTGRFRIQQGGV